MHALSRVEILDPERQALEAKDATAAGADIVGFEDLAAKIKEGFMDFDVVIASPDAMRASDALAMASALSGVSTT